MKKPIRHTKPSPKPAACAPPSVTTARGEAPQAPRAAVAAPARLPPAANLLTAKELGGRFGKSQFTVYRWINEGLIPERLLHYRGKREMLISIEALDYLRTAFREMHD